MAESNNLSSPGEGKRLLGSQIASEAAANLLWRGAKGIAGDAWNLIKAPGQILERSLTPSMEPGPNQLSIPEYALGLAGMGLGAGNVLGGAGTGAARQFGAWHGTRAKPFQEFSDEFLRSGEGHMTYGHGHYVGQAEGTGVQYRRQATGGGMVPVDEEGVPLRGESIAQKFYEPGTITPSYGGNYDRVMSFVPSDEGTGAGWYTNVKQVQPDLDRIKQDFPYLPEDGIPRSFDLMSKPEYWKDVGGVRTHATFPDQGEIERVGHARGWQMGEPGALLRINVVPEEHEFLDWDLPWSKQDPEIREQMFKAKLDPTSVSEGTGYNAWAFRNDDPTGEDIYRQIAQNHEDNGLEWDKAWEQTSKDLDAAGIPGNKYLDRQSRDKTPQPVLKHVDDFKTAPNPQMAEQYVKDYPAITYASGGSIDDEVRAVSSYLRNTPGAGRGSDYHKLADWVDSEHAAGKFSIGDNRTRNFVVFDPKNLEIRTWNGRQLTPVEGNPFGGGIP
jgi:hypothetical protein